MSRRESCRGCEGKGWVMIVTNQRVQPWLDEARRPIPGQTVTHTNYEAVNCPICRGEGMMPARPGESES